MITEELCGHAFSASSISAINKRLDESLKAFAERPLQEPFAYLIMHEARGPSQIRQPKQFLLLVEIVRMPHQIGELSRLGWEQCSQAVIGVVVVDECGAPFVQDHRMGRNFLAFSETPTTPCSPPSATISASCSLSLFFSSD